MRLRPPERALGRAVVDLTLLVECREDSEGKTSPRTEEQDCMVLGSGGGRLIGLPRFRRGPDLAPDFKGGAALSSEEAGCRHKHLSVNT